MLKLSSSNNKKPLFITIEGIEGAGKSTNAQLVVEYLRDLGFEVVHTREPGGTVIAEKIRKIFLDKTISESITNQAELLMLFAARSQHLEHLIIPALHAGKCVVCERFTDASFAYQGGGRGIDLKSITFLENFVQKDLRPDLVLLFDVDVAIGLERIKKRKIIDRIEQENMEFFNRVRKVYLKLAKEAPNKHFIIDANQDLLYIKQQIIEILNKFLYAKKLFD